MRFIKHLTTWFLLLTVITASSIVSAKVASGSQNLSGGLHQENVTAKALMHLVKIDFSYNAASGSPVATKGGTYKLRDADGVVRRTGKSNNLDRRSGEHARNRDTKDLRFEVDRKTDCCNAQRGREQIIYDKHPEAQAANGGLNKRRPVSPTNPKRDIYRRAGEKL